MDHSNYLQYTPTAGPSQESPSSYLRYSPPAGLPQESKLATYMNRNSTPIRPLRHAMGNLSLESSPSMVKKQVMMGEFVPINYFSPINISNMLPESPENSPPMMPPPPNQVHQENVGGTTYFYSTATDALNANAGLSSSASMGGSESCMMGAMSSSYAAAYAPTYVSPYASQIYSGAVPHTSSLQTKPELAATFYMPETVRAEIYERNEDVFLQVDPRQYPDIPENVEMYTELVPLENANPHVMATSFRATHRESGEHYALRRLHSYSSVATKRLEMWKQIDHPNVVRLHECFLTQAFGDHSMVMVYDYHPSCVTLMKKYLSGGGTGPSSEAGGAYHDPFSSDPDAPRPYTHQKNAMLRAVACGALMPEAVLWSLLVQLTAGMRAVHTAGLACCNLDSTKVVMNGCRVRIAWCGAVDAVHINANDVVQAQQEDLCALGRLALSLACRTIHCENLSASMELISRTYSPDLKNLIMYLLSSSPARRSVNDLMPMIGARFYSQVEALQKRADAFEEQLAVEIDNGRLLRILIKLGLINERPELNMDTAWSETGDRYMLKLFRDYLFHSVTSDGRPWLDQGHLVHSLNQLDGGSHAKVELMSRDEHSVLVVSYAELKHCLEHSYEEVLQAGTPGT